jgi:ABC-type polysaccharide/polyol phosphate export permease
VFILCGLVPFNFFTLAWSTGTGSLLDNAAIMKRVPAPREIIPIATVLGNCLHLVVQIGLLLTFTLALGLGVNRYWIWLPYIWAMYIIFVCGLTLISSALNVFVRDIRYLVEAFNAVLFWIVPVIYDFSNIPQRYKEIYALNPVAALILALRSILIQGAPPPPSLLFNLCWSSFLMLGVGLVVFRSLKGNFYDYL